MNKFLSGIIYACQGIQDLFHPKIRHYIYVPLIINLLIFGLLFYFGIKYITQWNFLSPYDMPSWLSWLSGATVFIEWILKAILYVLLFSTLALLSTIGANFIASPFNGLLSEAFSKALGHTPSNEINFFKLLTSSVLREIKKFGYYLPRALVVGLACAILHFIPVLNILVPVVLLLFTAWMMAIQYLDYPADNHQIAFKNLLENIKQNRSACIGFGLIIAIGSTVPIINFIIMPAAVLGATRLWFEIKSYNNKRLNNL